MLFKAARAAKKTLALRLGPLDSTLQPPAVLPSSSSADPLAYTVAADEDMPHGLVPEALSLMVGGCVSLHSSSQIQVRTLPSDIYEHVQYMYGNVCHIIKLSDAEWVSLYSSDVMPVQELCCTC